MRKILTLFTVFSLVSLVACAPKKDKERIGRGGRSGVQLDANGRPTVIGPGIAGWQYLESGAVAISQIQYNSSNATTIDKHTMTYLESLMGLISSTINIDDPEQFQNDPRMGASFGARLSFINFNNCQINPQASLMGIVVFDGIGLQDRDYAIKIYMGPGRSNATSGFSNGACNVQFSDEFGTITLRLQMSGSTVMGDIYYRNTTSTVNYPNTNIESYLGTFQVPANGILIN